MSPKKRTTIPADSADTIVFESDRSCCICRCGGKAIQIHHLDGDSANNKTENLAVLCLEHHHEASSKSSIGRGLSAGVIARYRAEWYATVKERRETSLGRSTATLNTHETLMEALACHEIRKIAHDLQKDWDLVEEGIEALKPYSDTWRYGDELREEIISVLYSLSSRTRHGMPVTVARSINQLISSALPIVSLIAPANHKLNSRQHELFKVAIATGFALAYDGIKRREDPLIVAEGAELLRTILRFARVNELADLKKECLSEFERLISESTRREKVNMKRWLEFERDDALALDGEELPNYPGDIAGLFGRMSSSMKL